VRLLAGPNGAMLAVESTYPLTQDSTASEHASSSTGSLDRTELDDLLDELLGQAATTARTTRTRLDQLRTATGTATRRRTPQPMIRNDSLSALRLAPSINPSLQPLHTRLQIDIEVDQRTGSARIGSWSPVSCDSAPSAAGYSNYGRFLFGTTTIALGFT